MNCLMLLTFVCYWSFFFFFSSRRRHTRSDRDWSSDVCSSDLKGKVEASCPGGVLERTGGFDFPFAGVHPVHFVGLARDARKLLRSEERRVGKECKSRGSPYH